MCIDMAEPNGKKACKDEKSLINMLLKITTRLYLYITREHYGRGKTVQHPN